MVSFPWLSVALGVSRTITGTSPRQDGKYSSAKAKEWSEGTEDTLSNEEKNTA